VALRREVVDHINEHSDAQEDVIEEIESTGRGADEWFFYRYLEEFKLLFQDYPAMDRTMEAFTDKHPHTWKSLEEERSFMWDAETRVTSKLLAVLHSCRKYGHLFFRKVGPIDELTWAKIIAGDGKPTRVGKIRVK
jgi:hypothetical protein